VTIATRAFRPAQCSILRVVLIASLPLASTSLARAEPAIVPDQPVGTIGDDSATLGPSAKTHAPGPSAVTHELAPPAPILMPELVSRSRLTISPMVSSALLVNLLQLDVTGTSR